ncbi:MAG: AAA family ATPase [Lachnospiraceae bacterium]|nr:AAA family ATPase [Lachnospiraceae bacterium]
MDATKYMIIIKDEIATNKIKSCIFNVATKKYDITFNNGKTYHYLRENVMVLNNPIILQPQNYVIKTYDGIELFNIRNIYQFENEHIKYWHIVFDKYTRDCKKDDLIVDENCLQHKRLANTFEYLKEVSKISELKNDNGELILSKHYDKVDFVSNNTVLSQYLDSNNDINRYNISNFIFPFGCNQSQYKAVANAIRNQVSIIQGPPGTGKTQTILNIIANLIVNNKTVMVVSNNNSATLNILEKLSKEEYGMDFIVASLGSSSNKKDFIKSQSGKYPNFSTWNSHSEKRVSLEEISQISEKLQYLYQIQKEIAKLKEKKYEIQVEQKHFDEFASDRNIYYRNIGIKKRSSANKIMQLLIELQNKVDNNKKVSLFFKLKSFLLYGIASWEFYKEDPATMITTLKGLYYECALKEISNKIKEKESEWEQHKGQYQNELEKKSLIYLKDYIANKYKWSEERIVFTEEDLYKNARRVLEEYPVVLSTTFSSRSSLNSRMDYDYVIMDEASQIDIATGALALSCAKNVVIVGDTKQLPNVVTADKCKIADTIRLKYSLSDAYDFAHKSFLQSIIDVFYNAPSTLLREHYRCHPRIISFCNQKFYNNELVIMTKDDDSKDTLKVYKTMIGNHERDKYNQRQIDIIKNEILPILNVSNKDIGIITPYNKQVDEIKKQIKDIDIATVHKFQGREKDVIIISTVDDIISDFTDDPYLLNVAVSRAKKKLIVVVSGNKQKNKGNIVDLISYIQYNKGEIINSQIYSIFDFLYSMYRETRNEFLRKHKKISQYDSENLTFVMLQDILKKYPEYGIVCFQPLSMVVRDLEIFTNEEIKYILNPSTHSDFIIYNKLSKQPILAVETDGYMYHKQGTAQYKRDELKNSIFEKCNIPLVRLSTNGSQEKEKILEVIQRI